MRDSIHVVLLVLVSRVLFEFGTGVGGERATITYSVAADANTSDESEWEHD